MTHADACAIASACASARANANALANAGRARQRRPSLTKPTPRLQPGITRSGDQPMRFSVSIECILALAV